MYLGRLAERPHAQVQFAIQQLHQVEKWQKGTNQILAKMENGGMVRGQTTTTTTITETHVQTNIRFDPSYLKTLPGALKLVAIVSYHVTLTVWASLRAIILLFQILNLVVFICGVSASNYWRSTTVMEWAYFVSMTAFWVTLILTVMYLFHFTEKFHVIPW